MHTESSPERQSLALNSLASPWRDVKVSTRARVGGAGLDGAERGAAGKEGRGGGEEEQVTWNK